MKITVEDAQMLGRAMRIANAAVVSDIQDLCPRQRDEAGTWWYDTRPMLDAREISPPALDMNAEAIAYALQLGLVAKHAEHAHLVRVVPSVLVA